MKKSNRNISEIKSGNHTKSFTIKTDIIWQINSKRDRIELDKGELKKLPFYYSIDKLINSHIKNSLENDNEISYVIWGGVATNLLLQLFGITKLFYSLHDIEMFLTKNGNIYLPEILLDEINGVISKNEKFLLEIGGISILRNLEGNSTNKFQEDRIKLKDGDLFINNIMIEVVADRVYIDAPLNTIKDLFEGKTTLKMKNPSNLVSMDRIGRRIYRTIAKVIRFENSTRLTLENSSKETLYKLIKLFSKNLKTYFNSSTLHQTEIENWLNNENINDYDGGIKWLYTKTVSETAKRLAGIYGINSLDKDSFLNIFFDTNSSKLNLFENPMLKMIEIYFLNPEWIYQIDKNSHLANLCYLEYLGYQKPGAEKLCDIYSIS